MENFNGCVQEQEKQVLLQSVVLVNEIKETRN